MTTTTTATSDRLRLAHHEGGHLVAAMLADELNWTRATIRPDDPTLDGGVWVTHRADVDPVILARFAWFGPAAEARFSGEPLADVIRSKSCTLDRAHYGPVLSRDPGLLAPWSELLNENWHLVERAAVTLALRGALAPNDQMEPTATVDQVLAGFR